MTDVHTKMKEDVRQIFGKVEINYTDPFIDQSLTASASRSGRYTIANQLKDEVNDPTYKYFSLHNNKLDGTFHPLPSASNAEQVGWWDTVLSDATGSLPTSPVITFTFDARPVYTLKVVGDSILNEYPVDFTIKLYDASNIVVHTETVVGNTLLTWTNDIADIGNITKMELTITKINKPNTAAKILEFYTGVIETYEGERIIEMNLLEEQVFDDMTLPIGNVSSNELDIRFDNVDKKFDPRNTSSPLYGMMKRNRRVKAWLGVDLTGGGTVTWYPLGVYYTVDWKAPTDGTYAETTARDRLELLKQREFTASQVYQNYNLYQLAEIVLQDFGLNAIDYSLDTALQSVVIPYAWFDRMTHREALAKIAEAGLARLYCDRNNKIKIEVQRTASPSVFAFTDNETIYSADYPLAWGQITNYAETESRPRSLSASETVFQSTETVTVAAGGTVTRTYTFNSIPCMNVSAPVITAGANVSVQSYTAYAWGMVVTYQNTGGTSQTITNVSITGQKLGVTGGSVAVAQDATSIRDNGRLTKTIGNDFIQTIDRAQAISDSILATYKNPRHDIDMNTRGHVTVQLGDKITAPAFEAGTTADYYVVRQDIKWDGALSAKIKGIKT